MIERRFVFYLLRAMRTCCKPTRCPDPNRLFVVLQFDRYSAVLSPESSLAGQQSFVGCRRDWTLQNSWIFQEYKKTIL